MEADIKFMPKNIILIIFFILGITALFRANNIIIFCIILASRLILRFELFHSKISKNESYH